MCIRDRRKAGLELGIPEKLVFRQPFPGPGLGIRIIGEVNADKVRIVQDADFIYREEVDKAAEAYKNEHGKEAPWMPNQYFAALTNMRSVGVTVSYTHLDVYKRQALSCAHLLRCIWVAYSTMFCWITTIIG